jgi:D-sedoheptulose 7-phosphate isomerase
MNKIKNLKFNESIENHLIALESLKSMIAEIEDTAASMMDMINQGGRIFWMGNGGSAADAQHYAAELMVRYTRNREPIPSIALTTDSSLITAHSNDFEYETVFSRQVKAHAKANDVFVGISTSGNSKNILLAMKEANNLGCMTVGLLGNDGGVIAENTTHPLVVKNNITAHIQECHLIIGHYLCDFIELNHS